jgi:cytidine deaminase
MIEKIIEIKYIEYESINELSSDDAFLVTKAREASLNAWAPYSNFRVGAAVQLDNGEIITGNNQENAAYPSGLCAERVALFSANSQYPNSSVLSLAISANNKNGVVAEPIKPCGSCRQVILESEMRFDKPIRMILDGTTKVLVVEGIKNLLPLSFGKTDLE